MILGSTTEKKKHLCNYSAFLSLCCLPATHSLSDWNTLSCITAAIIGCTYMYGFSTKLHLKSFFSSALGFHESKCTHRKSLTHKTDLYWITVSQALLLLLSKQVERLINDPNSKSSMSWRWTKINQSAQRVTNNRRLTCRICMYLVDAEGFFS